ncbi:bi-domain-containing oxidoreductase [Candidatus Villigracilis saccharophilus]|uniref:bi-domain-containing oxidoreductase n=1 Tax=Candidatus Villigracilis saccharophilus TaxID=3140684 RepID=UPI003135D4CC|nr:bi-domain-containing oxidoreductase [Anaerolineales bacterium]
MKQLLQNVKNGNTTIEEVPMPTPREGMALVKIAASLVSAGTERMIVEFAEKNLVGKARSRPDLVKQVIDKARREGIVPTLQAAFNRLDQPMTLGYSSAGTIVALGKNMQGFKVGQRVACAGAGYAVHAEYNIVPRNLITPLPKNVDFESAAFTTLGAIAMQGFRLAEPQLGENVAIIGLGLLGLLTIQLAAAAGCNVLGIDLDPKRIKLASSLGFEAVTRQNAESASVAFTANRGFDSIIICADTSSNDPIELAGVIARDRAKVVATGAVGLTIPRKIYFEKEISLINSRSYGPGRYDPSYEENGNDYPIGYVRWTEGRNLQSVVDLMAGGKLKVAPLISHRFPIEQAATAYDVITGKKKETFLGVLLTYSETVEKLESSKVVRFNAQTFNPSNNVKLGVLGAGLYANSTLLPVIKNNKDFELIGIASSGGLHAQHSGKKYGFQYATSSDDEIINDPNVNTVAILTRHDTHADLVIKALKAGKHVFVEKPLAINSVQLLAINKQLKANSQSLLTVGFNRRFSPLALKLFASLSHRSEPLHAHYRVNAGYIPLNHWTQDANLGGGRIIGEGCHFIDLITFLVGAAPVSVTAHALPDNGKYRMDNVSMTFTFPDGSIGVVDYLASGDKSFQKERVEVFCAGQIAVLDDYRSLTIVKDGKRSVEKLSAQDKGWRNEMQAFARAIREGGAPPIPYDQIMGVTQSTFAAVESIQNTKLIEI